MNKFLKILIAILIIILCLALLLMFVSPKKMVIKESMVMDAPANMIFNQVNDFKKWQTWSPWAKMDPEAINSYSKKSAGVGAEWNWKGNEKVGEGTQRIVAVDKGKSIKTSLEFAGMSDINFSNWSFEPDGNKTKVTWDFDGAESKFFLRPFNLIFKSTVETSYKEGLSNIKAIVEKRAKEKIYGGYKINELDIQEKNYIAIRQVVQIENIQQFYARNLPPLFGKVTAAQLEIDGMPGGLFYKWNDEDGSVDMAASIPIKIAASVPDATLVTIPAGRAIQVDYYGNYEGSKDAHYAIDEYINDYNLLTDVPIIEEYVTDPTQETDPTKWLTKISYYIAEN